MEKRETKFKWNKKNNGIVFSLCLVAVAAVSVLFATGQVRQAQKAKEEMVREEAAVEDSSFVPQVDEAMELALDQEEDTLLFSDMEEDPLEAVTSDEILREEETEEETDLEGEEAALTSDAAALETEAEEIQTVNAAALLPTVTFDESDTLSWPVAGNVVLDYSMDGSIYFPTLQQYKYNPALVIGSDEGAQVIASARGIVERIAIDEETGNTVTMSLGNGYQLTYGQLQELTVSEGDVVNEGELIGYVSSPTKYYCKEGTNLYFAMTKEDQPVDPVLYLE